MIVDHHCYECDTVSSVITKDKKVICPICQTENDWWLEGEKPPENHRGIG